MGEHLLKAAVPVDWLDDLALPTIGATSLAAGTCLDGSSAFIPTVRSHSNHLPPRPQPR
jgi:hypothetical protein